jgi:hypothetical protein
VGDLDNDGDPDVVLTFNGGAPRVLLASSPVNNGWLGLRVLEPAPVGERLRPALGAQVTLTSEVGQGSRVARVATDGSYGSASDSRVLFGLGESYPQRLEVVVTWPDGSRETFSGLAADRYVDLVRGTGQQTPNELAPDELAAHELAPDQERPGER